MFQGILEAFRVRYGVLACVFGVLWGFERGLGFCTAFSEQLSASGHCALSTAAGEVVGENSLDSTAVLALAPKSKIVAPDFVNTQALSARVLVQALAYPSARESRLRATLCEYG